ncbi:MAG TPA: hypothetical protein VFW11_22240 [Cyclobacteriaceae bacterium]|nr:hypothetical protein [Cyclobacteriaceae bacterium]
MRTLIFACIFGSLTFLCCNSIKDSENSRSSNNERSNGTISVDENGEPLNFLNGCPQLNEWIGGIVGVNESDSTGPYYFAECLNVDKTYRLLWVIKGSYDYRKSLSYKNLKDKIEMGRLNSYKEFDIYSFVIPLVDAEKMEDEHQDYTKYPAPVSVYKRIDEKWTLIKNDTVNNLPEFGQLQLDAIFGKIESD